MSGGEVILTGVNSGLIDDALERQDVAAWFDLAVRGDNEPVDRILADLRAARRQMWLALDLGCDEVIALALTQIRSGKVDELWITNLVGRDRERWLPLLGRLERWALANGCARVVSLARPGWARVMRARDQGWRQSHIMLEKELGDGQQHHGRSEQ